MNPGSRESLGAETPYAPHTDADVSAMLAAIGAESEDDLFDIPDPVRFEGAFDIEGRSEQAIRKEIQGILDRNADVVEFLGRGEYDHYVPAVVDDLAGRSEFLTSYTQYQPEVAQGFLQALFEYQSLLVELTGMDVANCSTYDAATALGEAATLSQRVRSVTGDRLLVPAHLREGKRAVLANYTSGHDVTIEAYGMADGATDLDDLAATIDDDVAMVYAENPSVRGVVQPDLAAVGDLVHDQEQDRNHDQDRDHDQDRNHDCLFCVGSDPIALSLLESPGELGADVVVGTASTLGVGASYGLGLGLFATREEYLRQVPGRLVGAAEDETGRRAYTLTLQTREQHIRRERATSNICTNQAWLALRAAIHAAWLGPDGLIDLAEDCVANARDLAERIDAIDGVTAPVHDRHHFREFVARTDRSAPAIRDDLVEEGYAIHAIDDHHVQICVTETTENEVGDFVTAIGEVA